MMDIFDTIATLDTAQPQPMLPALRDMLAAEAGGAGTAVAPRPAAGPLARQQITDWHAGVGRRARAVAIAKRDWTHAVSALLEQLTVDGQRIHSEHTAVALMCQPDKFPLLATAGKQGGNAMTVFNYRKWRKKLIDAGHTGRPLWDAVGALVKRSGHTRAKLLKAEQHPDFLQQIMGLYMRDEQPALTDCHRKVLNMYKRGGYDVENFPTVADLQEFIASRVSKTTLTKYREGGKAYSDTVRGFSRRDWSGYAPGDVFVSDHRQVDFWVRHPDPNRPGEWIAVRPYVTIVEDVVSRYIVAVLIYADTAPNHMRILECLLRAVENAGNIPPLYWYTDQGKDYLKMGFATPVKLFCKVKSTDCQRAIVDPRTNAPYEHCVLYELAIEHWKSRGYNGQEKPAEGSFATVSLDFDRWQVGYCGRNTLERARLGQKEYHGNIMSLQTVGQAQAALERWLAEEYQVRATKSEIVEAATPALAWEQRTPIRPPWDEARLQFAFLMPQPECPTVGRTTTGLGGVSFRHGLYSHAALRERRLWGRPVMVKTSWAVPDVRVSSNGQHLAPERVWLFQPDGSFICEAWEEGLEPARAETDEDRARLAARCHVRNKAAAIDTAEYQALTGRTQTVGDPQRELRRIAESLGLAEGGQVVSQPLSPGSPRRRLLPAPAPQLPPARLDADVRAAAAVGETVRALVDDCAGQERQRQQFVPFAAGADDDSVVPFSVPQGHGWDDDAPAETETITWPEYNHQEE